MKNKNNRIVLTVLIIVVLGVIAFSLYHYGYFDKSSNEIEKSDSFTTRYDFDNFDDWMFYSQDTASIEQYRLSDGNLFLKTRAQTYDRSKAKLTSTKLRTGKVSTRVYIPTMYPNDQTSIALFLYHDDTHELDFEIGYGQAELREEHNADPNEALCYMTSQSFGSEIITLEMGKWYTLEIDLTLKDDNYFIQWLIDGEVKADLQESYGSEFDFSAYLSLENLKFLGDHISNNDYEVEFDWLEITHYE